MPATIVGGMCRKISHFVLTIVLETIFIISELFVKCEINDFKYLIFSLIFKNVKFFENNLFFKFLSIAQKLV